MAAAFQQQIFALDARFNAYRAPGNPNFKTLYIRRRSQLLRENAKFKDIETIKKYINIRSQLLQRRYGVQDNISISSTSSRQRSNSKASLAVDECVTINPKKKNDMSISENYAFSGVHHIFDQHTDKVSMVKFANNDRSKLCCVSDDGKVSVCDVTATPPKVSYMLEGHTKPVTGCDWSASNELLATCALDGWLLVWHAASRARLRAVRDQLAAPLLCCAFQPINNNMLIAGNARGMVEVLNVSTGIYPRGGSSILGGQVLSIACESSGRIFWAGNDKVRKANIIVSSVVQLVTEPHWPGCDRELQHMRRGRVAPQAAPLPARGPCDVLELEPMAGEAPCAACQRRGRLALPVQHLGPRGQPGAEEALRSVAPRAPRALVLLPADVVPARRVRGERLRGRLRVLPGHRGTRRPARSQQAAGSRFTGAGSELQLR